MLLTLLCDNIFTVAIYPPQRRYKDKKVFPTSTKKCPGHRLNPDLYFRSRACYLLDYVNPDLHRVIYTTITHN